MQTNSKKRQGKGGWKSHPFKDDEEKRNRRVEISPNRKMAIIPNNRDTAQGGSWP